MSTKNNSLTFWGHLQELRRHLIRSALAVFIFSILAFVNKDIIFELIILAPKEAHFITNQLFCQLAESLSTPALCINQSPLKLINIDMAGQFTTHLMISIIAGFIIAFPYLIFEIWRFISPALTTREKAASGLAVTSISLLFFTGVLFSYFLIVPLTINFLGTYQVSSLVENQIALRSYISTVSGVTFATGLVFELPVLVYFFARIGVLTSSMMRKNRKISFVIILVLSAIITPPDIFSQIMVGLPLYVLYEISIFISKAVEKNQKE